MAKETFKIKLDYSQLTRPSNITQHINEINRGTKFENTKYSRKEKYKFRLEDYIEEMEEEASKNIDKIDSILHGWEAEESK